jgi:hypothetical protein
VDSNLRSPVSGDTSQRPLTPRQLSSSAKARLLIADLIRDCSRRNGIILDSFGGSGTTLLAADRTGRVVRVIELDQLYVDIAVRRWEKTTGIAARHSELGLTITEIAAERTTTVSASSEPRCPGGLVNGP